MREIWLSIGRRIGSGFMDGIGRAAVRKILRRCGNAAERRRRGFPWLMWLTGALLLGVGILLRHPLLLARRAEAMWLLFAIAPAVLAIFLRSQFPAQLRSRIADAVQSLRPSRPNARSNARPNARRNAGAGVQGAPASGWALAALWASAIVIGAMQQGEHLWRRQQILRTCDKERGGNHPARPLGARLVVGYTDAAEVARLAHCGLIGGIFVGAHNVRGRDIKAIRQEIAALQAVRQSAGLPPLIVAADQEGGLVSRLSPPLPRLPPLGKVIAPARTASEIAALAHAYGVAQGRGLARLGINVNLAPLADLASPARKLRFDFHSQIGRRAIGADPERVAQAVAGYARGLETTGVRATLKHFPGLGRVDADTHLFPARLDAPPEALEAHDWRPFRQGLRESGALLMVGHATLSRIDAARPASLSHRVVDGIIRRQWRHDGALITDDLSMGAVTRHGLCRAGVSAVDAGVDLLLISYDADQYYTVLHCLLRAARAGRLDPEALAASQRRLAALFGGILADSASAASNEATSNNATDATAGEAEPAPPPNPNRAPGSVPLPHHGRGDTVDNAAANALRNAPGIRARSFLL